MIPHPPFSLHLAPCDFFLLPTVGKMPRGRKFCTADKAVEKIQRLFFVMPQDTFLNFLKVASREFISVLGLKGDILKRGK